MPPKAAAASKRPPKIIDPSEYQRKKEDVLPIDGSLASKFTTKLEGKGKRLEEIFPEWTVEGEQWDQQEETIEIAYPDNIKIVDNKSIKELLGLNVGAPVVDDKGKGKGKADPKKGAAPAEILEELDKDELGRSLPKILFKEDHLSYYLGPKYPGFRRTWSLEQKERKKYQDELKAKSEFVAEENTESSENSENPEAVEYINYKELYATALAERDVENEIPNGPEIDPIICDAFRLVSRFATQQQLQGNEQEFLWRCIYPKLPNGRPCYNPAGKYVVKLYLAGRWRRIVVNDVYPVDVSGTPGIASSLNLLELWPTILAKAIYTVYKSCGYDKTMPSLFPQLKKNSSQVSVTEDAELLPVQLESVSLCPLLTSKFLGFCLHCLTGWQPSTPWSLNIILNSDLNQFKNLLQQFTFGGAPLLEQQDKPGEIIVAQAIEETTKEGSVPTKMRTKSQLKEEYRKKLEERNTLVDKINIRQSKIDNIAGLLAVPNSEVFTLCVPDEDKDKNSMRILPVLGICYPADGKDNPDFDIRDVELMVEWTIIETADEIGVSAIQEINPLTPYLGGLDQPLPPFTRISYEWISIRELALKQAYAFGFDTLVRLPHKSVMGWAWTSAGVVPTDDKGKGKDKKAASSEPVVSGNLTEQGDPPPVLFTLDSAAFFAVNNEGVSDESNPAEGEGDHQFSRPTYTAKQSHLSISVLLHADNLDYENRVEGDVSLPSDVVLILQELRDDDIEPIVIRVELGQKCLIPLTSQTFHIPAQKILPTTPLVFWVRLFTKSSVMVYFGSSIASSFGKAETVYKDLGFNSIVQEGESPLIRPDVEQLLFRYPLSLKPDDNDNTATEKVFAFLSISDREIASYVSILVYSDEDSYSLPKIEGNIIPISDGQMLIARLFHSKRYDGVPIPCPSFKWKLVILSKKQLIEPVPLPTTPEQSFKGCYFPNNKLIICRDIINADKATFPLALKFTILPKESNDNKDMRFIFRTYRVSDRKLIGEYRARTMIQLYNLKLADFSDGVEEAPPAAKGKGKAPTGPEGTLILIEVSIDEAIMDIPYHWKSRFPFAFDNKISSDLSLSTDEIGKSPRYQNVSSQFEWQLDILAGSIIGVQHDIYDLERYAANKNAWEDASEGRGDKSAAAATYVSDKKKQKLEKEQITEEVVESEPQAPSVDDNLVALLVTALGSDAAVLKNRETLLLKTSGYKEYIQDLNESAVTMTEEDKESEKVQCEKNQMLLDEISRNGTTMFLSYNTLLKEQAKTRISQVLEDTTNNSNSMATLWKQREDNKVLLDKKNTTLKWLLEKTKEAIEKQQDAEDEASGKKPAKGKKK